MNTKSEYKRKYVVLLLFLSWLAYTAANVGRMNYSASMVAIIEETGAAKNSAGLVASFFFFAYGIGQLVNGLLCHKYNSRIAIFCSLTAAAAVNLALPFCKTVSAMKWFWGVNGAVQSVLWSSLVKLQAEYLNDKDVGMSILLMSTTNAAGTFLAYGFSALFVAVTDWRGVFYTASGLLIFTALAWLIGIGRVQKNLPKFEVQKAKMIKNDSGKADFKPVYLSLAFLFLFAVANGFIKDGVTTWVPNLLKETYLLDTSFSIILTLLLPLVSISGAYVAKLAHKKLPNEILLCGLFYLFGGGTVALVFWLYTHNLAVTVILFALVACSMAAINNVVTSSIPFRLRAVGRSGMFAGVINTFCYAGSTLASFLLGAIADGKGWDAVILVLLILSVTVGTVATMFSIYWKKKIAPLIGETPVIPSQSPPEEKPLKEGEDRQTPKE